FPKLEIKDRLFWWILNRRRRWSQTWRQLRRLRSLGYAPSHSQVRATVAALLRQQGQEVTIGVHWISRFMKRHPAIKTKIGRRQEPSRFNSFTPMAVNWYFDIREREYGWIKPENTVNVDEGGIMAGYGEYYLCLAMSLPVIMGTGLDSLVIGSSDPKRKAFLKGSQSRTWTSFIEAVTADGRLLKPGIIFKGKELQQQWFIEEFRKIADCLSTSNEAIRRDEWMATCFLNNVYCCYLPAHCSHGLQPLDNGVFNASKSAYRKELQKLASLTDSAPVDKVNFIRAYAKAREAGMTKKNIVSSWRATGNWPISRRKALLHPEIQPDKKETTPASESHGDGQLDSDNTPKTSRHIRDLGKNKSPSTRRRYSVISKGFEAQESKIASLSTRIASLEEEVGRLSRGKKRKAIPNPNKNYCVRRVSICLTKPPAPTPSLPMAPSMNPDISAALFSTTSTANSDPDTATSFNRSDDNTEANVDISSTAHLGYEGIDWHRLLGYLSSNLNKEEGSGRQRTGWVWEHGYDIEKDSSGHCF
ncbi:Transcription factor atf1, partial [Fusarium oxysporum f. sp. albedinis]